MIRFAFAFTSVIAAASLTTACSSNSGRQVTQQEYDDTAQQIGSTTSTGSGGGEVGSMTDTVKLSTGVMPLGLSLDIHGHVNGSRLGLTYDYQVTCTDAAGNPMALCSDQTDTAKVAVAWSGMLTLPNLTASVDRQGSWSLSGLRTNTPQLDGDGSFTFDSDVKSIFRTAESTYHLGYDATYEAVVIDRDAGPISGSIHYTVAATHTESSSQTQSSSSFDLDAVVTFLGNGTASLVLDGDQHYTIDLSTGTVTKA